MATVYEEILTSAAPEAAWSAIRAVDALHTRLVPGFVTATRLEGAAGVEGAVRVVTFGNGKVAREPIVTIDEERRRLVWSSTGGALSHYNASVQVFAGEAGGSRIVWIADLLPNALQGAIAAMMQQGAAVMTSTLDALPPGS